MAKKKNDEELIEDGEKKSSKVLMGVIGFIVVLVWLAIFAMLIKLDVGGFGSNVMTPILKNVPVLNKILPESVTDEDIADSSYPYKTLDEAIAKIKELEVENANLQTQNEDSLAQIANLTSENTRLKVFEDNQNAFQQRVAEFDNKVVFNDKAPDIDEYKKFYEGIQPENAAQIYQKVIEQQQYDEKIKNYAETYGNMEPAAVAKVFEEMTGNLDTVQKILWNLDTDLRAAILDEMDPLLEAKITALMEPIQNTTN